MHVIVYLQGLQMQNIILANAGTLCIYVLLMCIVPVKYTWK